MALFGRNPLLNDIRQAFRLLEEPLFTSSPIAYRPLLGAQSPLSKVLGLSNQSNGLSNAYVREAEDGKNYLVEAELPGAKKENLKVEFSENGEVLHITGYKGSRPPKQDEPSSTASADASSGTTGDTQSASSANANQVSPTTQAGTETSVETSNVADIGSIVPDWARESYNYGSFSNSFRFPLAVDVNNVQAKYEDGVLRLVIPKLEKDVSRKAIEIL